MTRRTVLTIAGLAVASGLSLVAVTNAWFINVDSTPEGEGVTSALVRYLPEEQQRSSESLSAFGNLISGGSVDPSGYPLVIPGDSLLSRTYVNQGKQVTHTSIARAYEEGDSAGTVIHTETRYVGEDSATRTQRDLMEGPTTVEGWYLAGSSIDKPDLFGYASSVTSTKDVTTSDDKTLTTTVSSYITTYVPPATSPDAPTYEYRQIITTKVHHKAAEFTGIPWPDAPTRTVSTEETVLSPSWSDIAGGAKPAVTRSSLVITDSQLSGLGGTYDKRVGVPLQIQNLSTVETQVRIALSVVLVSPQPGVAPASLSLSSLNGIYYFGKTVDQVGFIDLFTFQPYSDAAAGYSWAYNVADSDGTWSLWDLTLKTADAPTVVVPPISAPTVDSATGNAMNPNPVFYRAVQEFSVAGEPHDTAITDEAFQSAFNDLYCSDSPVIQVRLRYFVRQSDYMEWSQFYAQDTQLTFGGATTAEIGGDG